MGILMQEEGVGVMMTDRVRFATADDMAGGVSPLVEDECDPLKEFRPSDTVINIHATTSEYTSKALTMVWGSTQSNIHSACSETQSFAIYRLIEVEQETALQSDAVETR
jgi:hypothetical protein